MAEPIVLCWSGGKDASLALHRLLQDERYEVKYLLTTLNRNFKRISMHGVREELLDAQVNLIGIPLVKVWVREGSNSEYEEQMRETLLRFKAEGITRIAFGDIFLEDLKEYRDANSAQVGMTGIYPLWKAPTIDLIHEFLAVGFRAITCCVSSETLTQNELLQEIDLQFIDKIKNNSDPCGENGEYHTFCFDGPIFSQPVKFHTGETVFKPLSPDPENTESGFWFGDLLPVK